MLNATAGPIVGVILLVIVVALFVIGGVRKRVKKRQWTDEQSTTLADLARSVGGHFTTEPDSTVPWSGHLRNPFPHLWENGKLRYVARSGPSYDRALEFHRGRWHVRITETSIRELFSTEPGWDERTVHEHRIEIRVAPAPALRVGPILPPMSYRAFGKTRYFPAPAQNAFNAEIGTVPASMHGTGRRWEPVSLPDPYNETMHAFTEDQNAAQRALGRPNLDWLTGHRDLFQHLVTCEQGLLYASRPTAIDKATLLPTIDFLIGFLERIPASVWQAR